MSFSKDCYLLYTENTALAYLEMNWFDLLSLRRNLLVKLHLAETPF